MKRCVVIVDFGMGNLDSVSRALKECGASPVVSDDPSVVCRADRLVLPGVGAFADGARSLRQRGLDSAILSAHAAGSPVLGICLGMQLLATRGSEGGDSPGLGLIGGEVHRMVPTPTDRRLPHVGWNEVVLSSAGMSSPLFQGIASGRDFYFVHSYHFVQAQDCYVLAQTPYAGVFSSAVAQGSVFGVQFHPEKSQRGGLQLLRNFIEV